jgi:phage terminase large subunit-like protein
MIRKDWPRYYDVAPTRTYRTKIIQSWDRGEKGAQNDWSVCTTWLIHEKHFYLLDVTRGRYEYPRLRETAAALADRFKPSIIMIEDVSTGIALAHSNNIGCHIQGCTTFFNYLNGRALICCSRQGKRTN